MESQLQLKISSLKKQIESENKNNQSKRRRFSKQLKSKIVKFMNENDFTIKEVSEHLGIGFSTLEKWNLKNKRTHPFNKVEVAKLNSQISSNFKKDDSSLSQITRIQVCLVILIVLVTTSTIYQSLIYWRS